MKYQKALFTIFFAISVLFFFSCLKEEEGKTREDEINELADYLVTKNINTIPTWTGLYFLEDSVGAGVNPEYYDTVVIDFHASLLDGTTIASSEINGEAFTFYLWDWAFIHGLNEAVSYMNEGSKARAIIPSPLAFGAYSSGVIKPYSTLLYDLELIEVRPGIPVEPFSTEDLLLNTTNSGLQYYKVVQNEEVMVKTGNTVSVQYTAYLPNGNIFDSSVKRESPAEFTVSAGSLIPGFFEGLMLMKVGEKFRFIIPSDLGYGEQGSFPVIPPNSTLTFDIEVLEIKN
ncbi:MAG: FKBP-type peptidyl-prolyl cis-trans isomerase [Bacteroidales bacterium]|nr:FKBP-type peptidyl-prolyl cis-trans isomerase [Bacteroidales bacterium]